MSYVAQPGIPAVKTPPWRETDREEIRSILEIQVTHHTLTIITSSMNGVADLSPPTVTSVQAWVDRWKELETEWNAILDSGDVQSQFATEYEGLRPGVEVAREDMLKKADVLEWDVQTQYGVKLKTGGGMGTTKAGAMRDQMAFLADRICRALTLQNLVGSGYGAALLQRS